MTVLALDTECTTWNKGHPFDTRNFMVCWSWASEQGAETVRWPSGEQLQQAMDDVDLLVLFNAKFDLQWLVKEGLTYDPTIVS